MRQVTQDVERPQIGMGVGADRYRNGGHLAIIARYVDRDKKVPQAQFSEIFKAHIYRPYDLWSVFEENPHHLRVEVSACLFFDVSICIFMRPGLAIRAVRGQRIKDIHHGKNAGG